MTVGFKDVVLLRNLISSIPFNTQSTTEVQLVLDEFQVLRKNHCTVINVLAQALYELFSSGENENMKILREACFAYFELGGICIEHPIGFLSG